MKYRIINAKSCRECLLFYSHEYQYCILSMIRLFCIFLRFYLVLLKTLFLETDFQKEVVISLKKSIKLSPLCNFLGFLIVNVISGWFESVTQLLTSKSFLFINIFMQFFIRYVVFPIQSPNRSHWLVKYSHHVISLQHTLSCIATEQ